MIKNLWNLGIKVRDLDRELEFLKAVGAELILREKLPVGEEGLEYAMLTLGGTRLLLFPKVIFEDRIKEDVATGLTHAVYEVDDCEQEFERIKALGGEVLIEPFLLSAGLEHGSWPSFVPREGLCSKSSKLSKVKFPEGRESLGLPGCASSFRRPGTLGCATRLKRSSV